MAKVDVKLNPNGPNRGARGIRLEPAVLADMDRRVRAVAAAAGPGMVASSRQGATRARGSVITATAEARRAEATSRALTRALDAGR